MVRIKADGSIDDGRSSGTSNDMLRAAHNKFSALPTSWKVVVLSVVIFVARTNLNPNPLANGKIPAAALHPNQHWDRIAKDDGFVRTMTEHLGAGTFWEGRAKRMTSVKNSDNIKADVDIMLDRVDFGGPDGHVAERGDWSDIKYVQGTRCATTRSALTAYFCGAEVAGNQDYALGPKRKPANFGVQAFANFLSCRHRQGQGLPEGHRRSVYRIGIGCKDPLAGYSHAFSIIAQPDGTFYWLQSFIGHYSLPQWMTKMKDHQAHFTLDEILAKLGQVERLMNINGWTSEANQDYYELFGVDKEKAAMRRNKAPVQSVWKPSHRLQHFYWDEACEFPLPESAGEQQPADGNVSVDNESTESLQSSRQAPKTARKLDQCEYENIIQQLGLHGVGIGSGKEKKQELETLLD